MASNVVVKSDSNFEMNVIFYVLFQNGEENFYHGTTSWPEMG